MFTRIIINVSVLLAFSFVIADCASSLGSVSTVERSTTCPPPGTRVPYAQLLAQTRSFVGCEIETEVSFVGVGMGGLVGGSVGREGHSIFRATPPGQAPSSGPLGADFSYLTLPDGAAGPLFSATAGQRFLARGSMEMQSYGSNYDSGNTSRILRASSVAPAP